MCCREGVDKPPKPPKTSSAPTAATQENSKNSKQDKSRGEKPPQPTQNLNTTRTKSADSQSHDIHVVDMTGRRDDNEYAKVGPRDYRNLHRLHEKVNKPAPTRILSQSKPTFSYDQGKQPRLSFLQKGKESCDGDRISSDYDDDWMDDLPSTSVLLTRAPGKDKVPETSLQIQAPGDFQVESATASTLIGDEAADIPFEEDISDVEAAMVGLDDSRRMSSPHREDRLFLSTDSPEKPPSVQKKRQLVAVHEDPPPALAEEHRHKR